MTATFARKRLGQHFLHDPAVIEKILATIDARRQDRIVEIGGGRGALTRPLLERVDSLDVVEIDGRLAAELRRLPEAALRLRVHVADALRYDFGALSAARRSLRLVGNLPYNISTPLVFHILSFRDIFVDWHLMLQKEVVARMIAPPGTKTYGRLTVMLSAWTDIVRCFDIGPGAFNPAPKVWSSYIRVVPRATPKFPIRDEARFAELVARLFSMRRKTIGRALKNRLTPYQIDSLGIDPRIRPEQLAPEDFARLAELNG